MDFCATLAPGDWQRWHPGDWSCIAGHGYDGARLLLPLFELAAAPVACAG